MRRLLAALMLLTLVACGNNDAPSEEDTTTVVPPQLERYPVTDRETLWYLEVHGQGCAVVTSTTDGANSIDCWPLKAQ